MADVPPHLLERSRARRAAMGGDGDATPAAAAPAASAAAPAPAANLPAVVAAPASGGAGGGAKSNAAPSPSPAPLPAPRRASIPLWMTPVLVLLPAWALFYAGTYIDTNPVELTPLQQGAALYNGGAGNCSSCHGSTGGGTAAGAGVGRPLWRGEVELTFPEAQQQFEFVRHGSEGAGVGKPYGNPARPGGAHIAGETKALMPAFGEAVLTEYQLRTVIYYERCGLGQPKECAEFDAFWGLGPDGATSTTKAAGKSS